MCVAQSGHAPDLGVQGRRVGNRSNKQLEIQLCRTHQELRWSWPSSSERRPRFSRPPRSPRIIMIAPIGHPCTLGRASGANRRAMFAAKIRKGSLRRRASDRRTRRTVRAERSPAIVREHQSPGPASGALHSCSKRNPGRFPSGACLLRPRRRVESGLRYFHRACTALGMEILQYIEGAGTDLGRHWGEPGRCEKRRLCVG
jgi:hypothetical protein